MEDKKKSKELLVQELTELRTQFAILKKSMTESKSDGLLTEEALSYAESILETIREPLLVIPQLKISDQGLFDVSKFEFVDIIKKIMD